MKCWAIGHDVSLKTCVKRCICWIFKCVCVGNVFSWVLCQHLRQTALMFCTHRGNKNTAHIYSALLPLSLSHLCFSLLVCLFFSFSPFLHLSLSLFSFSPSVPRWRSGTSAVSWCSFLCYAAICWTCLLTAAQDSPQLHTLPATNGYRWALLRPALVLKVQQPCRALPLNFDLVYVSETSS